jgi:streptogramin lyase
MNRVGWISAALAVSLVACSSTVGSTLPATSSGGGGGAPALVTFVVVVPGAGSAAVRAHARRSRYMSASTQSIVIALGSKTMATANVASNSRSCKAAGDGSRICAAKISAPSGSQIFTLTAYDGPSGTGNVLASGNVPATVGTGASSVRVSLTGKPAALNVTIAQPYPPAGTATSTKVAVVALDADGNTIIGSYGGNVAIADGDASGATKLSTTSVATSSSALTLTYSGASLGRAVLSAKMPGTGSASATFAPSVTNLAQYDAPEIKTKFGLFPAGVSDICVGPDGNLWMTAASTGAIAKFAGGKFTMYLVKVGSEPTGLAVGSDKNLWFAEMQSGRIGRITTAGKVSSFVIPVPSGKGVQAQPAWVTLGPDGKIWFVYQGINIPSGFGSVDASGKVSVFPLSAQSSPEELVSGPDGNLWITDGGTNAIIVASTSGKIVATHRIPTPGAGPWGITVGPDKNVWFAEYAVDKIGRITTAGAIKEVSVPSASAGVLNVTPGPDGNVWFTESGGGFWDFAGKVGYVTPDLSVVREFPTSGAFAHVHDLVFDANGILWSTKFSGPFSALEKTAY